MTDTIDTAVDDAPEGPLPARGGMVYDPTTDTWRAPGRRGRVLRDGSRLHWIREAAIVVVVYVVYESVRVLSEGKPSVAFDNAMRIIDWQEALRIYHEQAIQDWSLQWLPLIIVSNYFYGIAYIAVTIGTLLYLYRRWPNDYPLWRNTLAVGTMLGLVGFATFPLMPPRLLDELGNGQVFGYVDTMVEYPTFWSFESEAMQTVSNQFAAMPSLHCGWAFWVLWVLLPRVATWWMKTLVVLYPIATIYVVVATGNHYFLDAVGGLVIFLVGYGVARLATRAGRGPRRGPTERTSAPEAASS
jgi:hypothetical protein